MQLTVLSIVVMLVSNFHLLGMHSQISLIYGHVSLLWSRLQYRPYVCFHLQKLCPRFWQT